MNAAAGELGDAAPREAERVTRSAERATPFALRLIIAFLAVDAVERGAELIAWWVAQPKLGQLVGLYLPNVALLGLLTVVDLMLVLFLLVRTAVGRWFGVLIFAFHAAYLIWDVAVAHPELWLYASAWGRARIPLTVGLDALAIGWLCSASAARHLDVR